MNISHITAKDLPEWVRSLINLQEFTTGEKYYFFDSICNKGILCKVKHGNQWCEDIPVPIKGIFIMQNSFCYITDSELIPKGFPCLLGSNTFTDAIPVEFSLKSRG